MFDLRFVAVGLLSANLTIFVQGCIHHTQDKMAKNLILEQRRLIDKQKELLDIQGVLLESKDVLIQRLLNERNNLNPPNPPNLEKLFIQFQRTAKASEELAKWVRENEEE